MAIRNMYTLFSTVVRIASSSNLSYKARIKSLIKSINNSFLAESTVVYLIDDEGRTLAQKVAFPGHDEMQACSIPLGEGGAGLCAATRKVVLRKNPDSHKDEVLDGAGQSMLSLPIAAGKELYGVISLGFKCDDSIDAKEIDALQEVCSMLAGLIQSWKSAEMSGKNDRKPDIREKLGKIVTQSVTFADVPSLIVNFCHTHADSCCTILRILQHNDIASGVYKRCRQRFRSSLSFLLEKEAQCSAKTIHTGISVQALDATDDGAFPSSFVCVPVQLGSRMLGTLTFFGKAGANDLQHEFDADDLESLESLASAVASVLEEVSSNWQISHLAAENDRKQKELLLLYSISNTMHSTINLNELIHMILKAVVAGITPIFERAMLFLVNERSGIIQGMQGVASDPSIVKNDMVADDILITGSWEISEEELTNQQDSSFSRMVKETRIPLDKSLNVYSRAVLDKKLYFISDATKERQEDRGFVKRFGVKAFAAVPLMVKGETVGLVIVDNPLTGRTISRDDLLFLQLLMNQAGTAIDNSMLHIRIEDAHRDFREIQQRLIQGEKLAAIGEMAASIAHELKGPLVSIGGFAKRLERKFVPGSSERKYAETIVHEVSRLEKMLTDTLFFSKKATICYASCNINSIVEESLAILSSSLEEKKIRVKMRLCPKIASFWGDSQQLKQVFINLFSNAGEAMKDGGTLSITVASTKLDGDNALSVTVSDTGGGIPVEILHDIFNPFFTTKECGTGLGLPITHRIVTNHGGRILVHNRPGLGAQFKVILPTHQSVPTHDDSFVKSSSVG